MSALVDPRVYELAAAFIEDMLDDVWRTTPEKWRHEYAPLVERAAAAMQIAIEDECEAIRQELVS